MPTSILPSNPLTLTYVEKVAGTRKEDDDDALPKDPPPPAPSRFAAAVQESVAAAAQEDADRCASFGSTRRCKSSSARPRLCLTACGPPYKGACNFLLCVGHTDRHLPSRQNPSHKPVVGDKHPGVIAEPLHRGALSGSPHKTLVHTQGRGRGGRLGDVAGCRLFRRRNAHVLAQR